MNTKSFKGANVFMSRKLVPPELFDTLTDALKLNGAEVFPCSDPSRNGPLDFHVISSPNHEKFADLRDKGCNLIGPQCILTCANERRALPKRGFICCLAMEGVKVLTAGIKDEEKVKVKELVSSMGGTLLNSLSSDVSFVMAKDVKSSKYKWAANKGKHIVTISWLYQCWNEHRLVSAEAYRVPPFLGLIICVTRIPGEKRKEMEKLVVQNGGTYSAELTKVCTHLICEVPEGDKFKVAKRWGNIHIVTQKWFDQSIAKRVCLNENTYSVQSVTSASGLRSKLMAKSSLGKCKVNSQSAVSSATTDTSLRAAPSVGTGDPDVEFAASQNVSSAYPEVSASGPEEDAGPPNLPDNDTELEGRVADDSEPDDNDLYLSDCRICFVGFDASNIRKLVGMVRKGGGSRYISCSERLTHIVVGAPSDIEKRELRGLAAMGVVRIVKRSWLEECDRQRKEVSVTQKHIAHDILVPKDVIGLSHKASAGGMSSIHPVESTSMISDTHVVMPFGVVHSGTRTLLDEGSEDQVGCKESAKPSLEEAKKSSQSEKISALIDKDSSQRRSQHRNKSLSQKPSNVFVGKLFRFSDAFPENRKVEVVEWINEGGGEVADDCLIKDTHFTVESHGMIAQRSSSLQTTYVSSHWVRACLEGGQLLDVGSHVLFSPLPCQIPLPGFSDLKICVSQYTDTERMLLRNLCFILGAKFGERLKKNVTHLLCKFTSGSKYEAACKWGIQTVTYEWLLECINKGGIIPPDNFSPKETPQDLEPGICTVSQYPTQGGLPSGNDFTQVSDTEHSSKRVRLSGADTTSDNDICNHASSTAVDISGCVKEKAPVLPDVAAAIEDLLEQTSKIQDMISPNGTSSNVFTSDCPVLGRDHTGHSAFGPSRNWLNSLGRKADLPNTSGDQRTGTHDGFSETQTDSQLVGYEEDLSGRQMIIDRVRTRSSMA